MEPDGIRSLLDPAGWSLLAGLPPYDPAQALTLGTALREAGFEPELVSAALTQSRLRAKARGKFGDLADDMLFTPEGLEQATRLAVAARHAHRLVRGGASHVADLGCGIGADALAIAGLGLRVSAVERDPTTATVASVNLRQFPEAGVTVGDALAVAQDLLASGAGPDAIWADPARRAGGRRLARIEDYSPAVEHLLELRTRVPRLGLKLSPALPHSVIPPDAHAQWVSIGGEVVEATWWFGPLAPEGPGRSALLLDAGGTDALLAAPGDPGGAVVQAPTGPVATYLHEPDGAVLRAGLVADVAERLGGHLIDPTIGYVTTDEVTTSRFTTAFRVTDAFPFSLKRLRGYLAERTIGRLEIKKRGSAVDPARLRAQLRLAGPGSATIVLTRVAGAQRVLVVERLSAQPTDLGQEH